MSNLTITLIQTNLHWEDKLANLQMLEKKIDALQEKTEIIILPEMFTTGFSMRAEELAETMDGPSVAWMRRISAAKKVILTGSLIITENGQYFNRLVWMLPNGTYGQYDKRHCFSLAGEDKYYTPGDKRLIASVKGWKVNLCICYDLRFPVWSRQTINPESNSPEFDLLIYVANWPDRRIHAWKTLVPARAIENQCFVAAVNRTGNDGNEIHHSGYSMVVDPLGEVRQMEPGQEGILTVTLDRNLLDQTRQQIPFWKDADPFLIL
jgi:predicted amidohydrolase